MPLDSLYALSFGLLATAILFVCVSEQNRQSFNWHSKLADETLRYLEKVEQSELSLEIRAAMLAQASLLSIWSPDVRYMFIAYCNAIDPGAIWTYEKREARKLHEICRSRIDVMNNIPNWQWLLRRLWLRQPLE